MSKKNRVSYVKPAEPSFLRKFKQDVGYKEGPTVDTKRQDLPVIADDSDGSDKEDELPQVVVLKKGDLSAEEVINIKQQLKSSRDEEAAPADGKILFKKPAKRSTGDKFTGINASSSKKKKHEESKEPTSAASSQKQVRNTSLLSFDEDED
ncbi:uncharacterized protein KIAA1143 homolog [Eleutherodactylus coqui]|uniref:DUF4604 domain-containing protein n=1 Tax=Eleutherodactylus coqui TaxID=57060 RepID=A0A8J6EVA7_ELECQ|nr:hypothetical protein GDO78_002863 [Eleutherodactylus coqui]